MRELELVIFDMDGLMFDSEKIAYRVWDEILKKYDYQLNYDFYLSMIGSNLTRIKQLCFNHFGQNFPFDEIKIERYELTSEIIIREGVPFKKGLIELLEFLKPLNIKKAVATSSGRDRANIFLDNANISHYFDTILCGDEITHSKPHPEIFLTVAKKLNCSPNHTIVLEDSEAGINAAYSACMKPIMIPDMKKPSDDILSKTFKCFESLFDVKEYLNHHNKKY